MLLIACGSPQSPTQPAALPADREGIGEHAANRESGGIERESNGEHARNAERESNNESGNEREDSDDTAGESGSEHGDAESGGENSEREGNGESGDTASERNSEHAGSSAADDREDGEESAEQFTKSQTYDRLRAGSRLILTYDAAANAFTGSVQNITDAPLPRVRVEIHLSNGMELGPTPPLDLAPGDSAPITLAASAAPFQTWSAHAEIGGGATGGEHASGNSERIGKSEGNNEHAGNASRERRGEHSGKSERSE